MRDNVHLRREASAISRRDWSRLAVAGVLGGSASGWLPSLAQCAAAEQPRKRKACILLWMNGGPAQGLTFDVKPDGPYKPIGTKAQGIEISEHLPKLAEQTPHMAILRGMSTSASSHGTGHYLMATGFPSGAMRRPALGAVVSHQIGDPDLPLPSFVVVDGGAADGLGVIKPPLSPAYAGPKHAPMLIGDPANGIADMKPSVAEAVFRRRAASLVEDNDQFLKRYPGSAALAHQTVAQRALALMDSEKFKALKLDSELPEVRERYGSHRFGQACLLARRLVEAGVSFVEVINDGWDDHGGAIDKIKNRSFLDIGFAALLGDLHERGMLENTLVVWMGEFGRTPSLKHGGHHCKAWTTVLAGAGIRGGQVIGRTDKIGDVVEDRPIDARTFAATVLRALGIDPAAKIAHNGFEAALVDRNAEALKGIF